METPDLEAKLEKETSSSDELIIRSLAHLDGIALGLALGILFGAVVFVATNVLLLKGGDDIGPNLSLLNQYFLGYDVSFSGSIIGLAYGFANGFVLGWLIAVIRNFILRIYIKFFKLQSNMSAVNEFIDGP